MTIKLRLLALLAVMGLLLLGCATMGNLALHWSHQSFKTVFDDRVICLRQFSIIRDAYDDLTDVSRLLRSKQIEPVQAKEKIERDLSNLHAEFSAYLATYLTPEEEILAQDLKGRVDRNDAIAAEILKRLAAGAASDFETPYADLLKNMQATTATLSKLTTLQVREAETEFHRSETTAGWSRLALLAALVLAALSIAYGVYTIVVQVIRPLAGMTATMTRLATGELEAPVTGAARADEIGGMARAVQVFKAAMIAKRDADAAAATENAAKMRRAQVLDDATRAFQIQVTQLTHSLSSAATEMEATAQTMSRTADQTAGQSMSVASAAEQTSANVQTVAAASEEMAASIGEIAQQVARSTAMAERAAADAAQSSTIVRGLAEGAEKIGAVVGLISGIAAQTNLLALNATIEAARAGEAGRGFAVVAGEVKELASQTARATETIAAQVTAIQGETREAVAAIQSIGATITELREIAVSVAAAMEEQGAATQEIVRNVTQAAQGTQSVTVSIGGVTQAASETGAASSQVLTAASELSRQSEQLGAEVSGFLATVRAA
ncbi:methyl-accepting chemotaxis protein [Methylobacterium sp. UNC378MF]|uniref:methyl-accepting chemotaxis protein n=1 Tax=Methylobacterium sp. UNC378MF TaxID=1502748 RepID=UPI0008831FED|nr:methyl-accepting chemotaxis protein [Methylobacterium sp. UNC378MF]SDA28560.1 methyl-accepting chemotaxis protein [Methylobacterium sp. UNC378MF]